MIKKLLLIFTASILVSKAFSAEVGWSVYPLQENQKMITAQFGGVFSQDGGFGMTASYLHKLSPKWDVEAGAGYTGGDRGITLYGAGDYEIFPDFGDQPRLSVKGWYQYSDEFNTSFNRFYASPLVSKSMVVWGHETYPYASIPTGVSLNYNNKHYSMFSTFLRGYFRKFTF